MWKELRFIIFLFILCLVLAIYDRWSGAFWLEPAKPSEVLGISSSVDN